MRQLYIGILIHLMEVISANHSVASLWNVENLLLL